MSHILIHDTNYTYIFSNIPAEREKKRKTLMQNKLNETTTWAFVHSHNHPDKIKCAVGVGLKAIAICKYKTVSEVCRDGIIE